jgi:glutamyl-tRNA synthetase
MSWRFATPPESVGFTDAVAGEQEHDPSGSVGDFVIWTKRGQPAYQLAVVVDDARQGVTQVVRGDDLLDSAARQMLLYRALGVGPQPRYWHVPLVYGEDGKRLAKRHGDTRVETYRERGVPAEAVIGLVAGWSGLTGGRRERMGAREFAAGFSVDRIPRTAITFTPQDDAWLLSQAR